jgi:hypothetical protein
MYPYSGTHEVHDPDECNRNTKIWVGTMLAEELVRNMRQLVVNYGFGREHLELLIDRAISPDG